MTDHSLHQQSKKTPSPWYNSLNATAWVAIAGLTIPTVFYLITRHHIHVIDALPYLFIGAMLFMHLGHGGHGGGNGHNHK
jgi:hypothetical protein